jgi:hypothetical protein
VPHRILLPGFAEFVDDGDFVAVVLLGALGAVAPDFHRQEVVVDDFEAELFEELRLQREGKYFWDAHIPGAFHDGLYHSPADAPACTVFVDSQRLDFGEVRPDHLESTAAGEFAFIFGDNKGLEILINIGKGTEEHPVKFRVERDQRMYPFGVRNCSGPYYHRGKYSLTSFNFNRLVQIGPLPERPKALKKRRKKHWKSKAFLLQWAEL